MPNWCHNHMIIGSAQLKEVIDTITNDDGKITFEKFLPTPPVLLRQTSPTPKDADEEEIKRLKEKYGASNWFDWRYENWGVKWDASDSRINEPFDIEFNTPWGPPLEFFARLSEKFPETEFKIQFADEMNGQYPLGELTIKNGAIGPCYGPKEFSREAETKAGAIWCGEWVDMSKYKNMEEGND